VWYTSVYVSSAMLNMYRKVLTCVSVTRSENVLGGKEMYCCWCPTMSAGYDRVHKDVCRLLRLCLCFFTISCASINVDGFMGPSNGINWSHGLKGFTTVSVELSVHSGNSRRRFLQHEPDPKHKQSRCILRYTGMNCVMNLSSYFSYLLVKRKIYTVKSKFDSSICI
jgi:hypothetical protein